MPAETTDQPPRSIRSRLSDATGRIMREYTGRGPTRARTIIDGDAVIVIMGETLTRGERKLADAGREDDALAVRSTFQDLMREDMKAAIGEIVGRPVAAFMSASTTDPDLSVEIFMLDRSVDDES